MNGAYGRDESDLESLARGTLPQHRVTKLSPRQPVEMFELRALFADALDGKSGSLDNVMYYSSIALLTISSCN